MVHIGVTTVVVVVVVEVAVEGGGKWEGSEGGGVETVVREREGEGWGAERKGEEQFR